MKTIFEKIIDREIPADIVYEDDICMAFLDQGAQTKGHTLLVTKTPFGRIQMVPNNELFHCMDILKKIIDAMIKSLPCDYVQIEMVGIGVPEHFHIHLIPRMNIDIIPESPHQTYFEGEKQWYVEKIKSAL